MSDVPRALIGRDPRDHDHVLTAFALVRDINAMNMHITKRSKNEVTSVLGEALADHLLEGFKTDPVPDTSDMVIVGSFYFLEQGTYFPDNVIVTCDDCKTALQFRPHSTGNVKLCIFCTADRCLKKYWEINK